MQEVLQLDLNNNYQRRRFRKLIKTITFLYKQMHKMKTIITAICLLIGITTQAQFFGIGFTNKGFNVNAGILAGGFEINLQHDHTIKSFQPSFTSLSLGSQILITHDEIDNISLTPSVGGAWIKRMDLTEYEKGGQIVYISKPGITAALELGKDIHDGRLSIHSRYIDQMITFGASIKFYFSR
jgi:hypothetical protein